MQLQNTFHFDRRLSEAHWSWIDISASGRPLPFTPTEGPDASATISVTGNFPTTVKK